MMDAESAVFFRILGEVLSRLAQAGPVFEAVVRDALETAAENLAIDSRTPVEPPLGLDYGHAQRTMQLLTQWALFECDVRASVARGETAWSPRASGK